MDWLEPLEVLGDSAAALPLRPRMNGPHPTISRAEDSHVRVGLARSITITLLFLLAMYVVSFTLDFVARHKQLRSTLL